MQKESRQFQLPPIDRRVLAGFQWYTVRYLRRHFHALAVNKSQLVLADTRATDNLVVFANHASWWDPLVALFLAKQLFGAYRFHAPIDARALEKYRIFGKLGFFPVQQERLDGAKNFLRTATSILSCPGTSLWITPEGRFADVRDHAAGFMPGLAHLASAVQHQGTMSSITENRPRTWFIPIAIEYSFWEERLPEILVWFGEPIPVTESNDISKERWNELLAERLRSTQQQLALQVIARNAAAFELLLGGTAGTSWLYDSWRWCVGKMTGRKVELQHGEKFLRK
jgi:1-acyl-sn-glycerol-3-phosphate acyltransferase